MSGIWPDSDAPAVQPRTGSSPTRPADAQGAWNFPGESLDSPKHTRYGTPCAPRGRGPAKHLGKPDARSASHAGRGVLVRDEHIPN